MLKARVQFLLRDVDQLFEVFGNAMKCKAKPADVITESPAHDDQKLGLVQREL